jgi:hypothetical protein
MASSVGQAVSVLRGSRPGDREDAQGFLDGMSYHATQARAKSEARTSSRPQAYLKKYRMGIKVYK